MYFLHGWNHTSWLITPNLRGQAVLLMLNPAVRGDRSYQQFCDVSSPLKNTVKFNILYKNIKLDMLRHIQYT